jgi:hypothetical protein
VGGGRWLPFDAWGMDGLDGDPGDGAADR